MNKLTKQNMRSNWSLLAMLLPGMILLLLFNYLPMAGIVIAFKKMNMALGILKSPWAGFKNFEFFIKNPDFPLIIRNTLGYNLIFLVVGNIVSISAAILLNELRKSRMSNFYQSVMLLPYFISWIAISYIVFAFLSMDKGFVNAAVLEPLGIEPVQWYTEKKAWPPILIFMNRWRYTGYDMVIYLAAIVGIDKTLYEAATVDGAAKFQQIRYVTLPMLSPIIVVVVLLSLGRMFIGDFDLFYAIPRNSGQLFPVTQVMDTFVFRSLVQMGNISMAAAAGVFQSIIGFVLIVSANQAVRLYDPEKSLF